MCSDAGSPDVTLRWCRCLEFPWIWSALDCARRRVTPLAAVTAYQLTWRCWRPPTPSNPAPVSGPGPRGRGPYLLSLRRPQTRQTLSPSRFPLVGFPKSPCHLSHSIRSRGDRAWPAAQAAMSVVHSWRSAGAGNHLQHVDLVQLRLSWGVGVRGGTPDIWTGPRASLTSHTINNNATRRKRRMLVPCHPRVCAGMCCSVRAPTNVV